MSGLFKLDSKDLAKGAVVAVLVAVLTKVSEMVGVPGFDFLAADWGSLASVAITAAVGYLVKNLVTDDTGKLLGKW